MSELSPTLVLHFKTSKFFHEVAKIQIKSEKLTPFGGIFHVMELFDALLGESNGHERRHVRTCLRLRPYVYSDSK